MISRDISKAAVAAKPKSAAQIQKQKALERERAELQEAASVAAQNEELQAVEAIYGMDGDVQRERDGMLPPD